MKIRNVNALLLKVLLFGAVASCDSGSKSKEERLDDLMDRADEAKAKSYYADAVDYHQAIIGLQALPPYESGPPGKLHCETYRA